ncbi:hypothetical protein CDV31_011180 [Fusarium ambrosium]|uniref:Uncharacterized protein n=1 Tax=Fusarium ambrosium TaxID=131363 RepID=A0A428TII5_9HYPO|nr:hypothetical protein CDV31_011180 [Fusarium ambrosium]
MSCITSQGLPVWLTRRDYFSIEENYEIKANCYVPKVGCETRIGELWLQLAEAYRNSVILLSSYITITILSTSQLVQDALSAADLNHYSVEAYGGVNNIDICISNRATGCT